MKRARSQDEIKPLIELCKLGHLYEVQEWITAGKPLDPPLPQEKKPRPRSPLQYTIDSGFHSLVQVLLEGGATIESSDRYDSLVHALQKRRFDTVRLLIDHGVNPTSVDMNNVFDSWDPAIVEYFVELGADLETGNPLAKALCSRMWPALRIFKRFRPRFPNLQNQLDIALRYHCKEGNQKWIALCMWAGADPYSSGSDDPYEPPDSSDNISALECAALYGHFDVFMMKRIRLNPVHPVLVSALRYANGDRASSLVQHLLDKGVQPNDQPNGGCSVIQELLSRLDFSFRSVFSNPRRNIDTPEAMEKLKTIHILAKHGAKWKPENDDQVRYARRALLRMTPDYTVEFVWIMSKYRACTRRDIEELLRTPAMRRHTRLSEEKVEKLSASLP